MANTRINYDVCRTKKSLQQATDPGRWVMDVPGNGETLFIQDPHIHLQKWGANLRTESIQLEAELQGYTRPLGMRDCLAKEAQEHIFQSGSQRIEYANEFGFLQTEQSRAIMPAWTARDLEQVDWYVLPLDAQENTCMTFQNNLATRIVAKDNHIKCLP